MKKQGSVQNLSLTTSQALLLLLLPTFSPFFHFCTIEDLASHRHLSWSEKNQEKQEPTLQRNLRADTKRECYEGLQRKWLSTHDKIPSQGKGVLTNATAAKPMTEFWPPLWYLYTLTRRNFAWCIFDFFLCFCWQKFQNFCFCKDACPSFSSSYISFNIAHNICKTLGFFG